MRTLSLFYLSPFYFALWVLSIYLRPLFIYFISIFTLLCGFYLFIYALFYLLVGLHCIFLGLFFQLFSFFLSSFFFSFQCQPSLFRELSPYFFFFIFVLFNVSPHSSVSYCQVYLFRHLPILYFQPSSSQDDSRPFPFIDISFHFLTLF